MNRIGSGRWDGGWLRRLVLLGTAPTAGLFVSSLRGNEQLATSEGWTALSTTQRTEQAMTAHVQSMTTRGLHPSNDL